MPEIEKRPKFFKSLFSFRDIFQDLFRLNDNILVPSLFFTNDVDKSSTTSDDRIFFKWSTKKLYFFTIDAANPDNSATIRGKTEVI